MKKVVHLTSVHPRYDQRILWRECCSLREHGYDVTLVVNDAQDNETLENGVKIMSTGFVPQGRWERMTEGVKRVYELGIAQSANIYHLHDPELLRIALRVKQQGKTVIFDSHEIYGIQIRTKAYIPSLLRNAIANIYTAYETYVCKRINGVIVPAKYDGKNPFVGRAPRCVYVNNYPRVSEYEGVAIPPYDIRKNVCYSGGLTAARGITNLVDAGQQAGVTVVLAGEFSSEEYKQEILENDSTQVRYLGFMKKRKDIFEMYARCAVGAALLRNVGQYSAVGNLPTKVYEYMAMEMPVLLSNFPYNRNLVEKYNFGLVANPDDTDDIAAKIRWLLDHPKEAEEMGKNGRRLLKEKFTWERAAESELLRLYREVEADM